EAISAPTRIQPQQVLLNLRQTLGREPTAAEFAAAVATPGGFTGQGATAITTPGVLAGQVGAAAAIVTGQVGTTFTGTYGGLVTPNLVRLATATTPYLADYADSITAAAQKYGVPEEVIKAIITNES